MEEYHFTGQKSGELVIGIFRKSLWAFVKDFVIAILVIALFVVLGLYAPFILTLSRAILLGLALAVVVLLRTWYIASNTVFLITSLRVIAISQNGIFRRDIKEAYITEVSQVVVSINGVFESMFNFGDIIVQTYGELILNDIKNPNAMKEAIYDAVHKDKKVTNTADERFWQVEGKK